MRNLILIVTALMGVCALLGCVYAIIAGIWEYNPTSISWFNTKLLLTCAFSAFLVYIIFKVEDGL